MRKGMIKNTRKDKRIFNRTARRVHKDNYLTPRGGTRK